MSQDNVSTPASTAAATPPDKPAATPATNGTRKRWLAIVVGAFAVLGAAYGAYWALALRYAESTDDAYVNGNVVQITPQVAGTVVSIAADDTQFVKEGDTLVQLDPADATIALEQAEAKLAHAVRDVRGLFANTARLQANVDRSAADVARATEDLSRRERLAAAQQELAAHQARVDHTTLANHPDVLAAAADVHDAYLAAARTKLPAPVSGYIARRAVQLGQRVAPGTSLMAVVPLEQVWVDANFKEPQLASLRVGQPVTLTADVYGKRVRYHGTIAGFGAGTGSAFALLPAQNATGNWIKVVQRVPVRIALDREELHAYPLQIGLSMMAEVDTHYRDGERLPQLTQSAPAYATRVYQDLDTAAARRVQQIIAANASATSNATLASAAATRLAVAAR